ncbi:N-6 DNA methylase [Bacteroidales bacterium AH-315-I05]|nr:N-6 DNA methylase [Bacteroidales bacterium AH-315-I05]
MKLEIQYNKERNGIELHFDQNPGKEVLSQVKAMGFRYSKKQNMWYAKETTARKEFAEKLKEAIDNDKETPSVNFTSSYEPTRANLENRNFSYITLYIHDNKGNSARHNYIVFEPTKRKAEAIARAFGKQKYGDRLQDVSVYPRTYIREARVLFEKGEIIGSIPSTPPEKPSNEASKIKAKEIHLATNTKKKVGFLSNNEEELDDPLIVLTWEKANQYVKEKVGYFPDVYYKVVWEDGETLKGSMDIEPASSFGDKQDLLSNHILTFRTNLSQSEPNEAYSKSDIEHSKKIINGYQISDKDYPETHQGENHVNEFDIDKNLSPIENFHFWVKLNGDKVPDISKVVFGTFKEWYEKYYPNTPEESLYVNWDAFVLSLKRGVEVVVVSDSKKSQATKMADEFIEDYSPTEPNSNYTAKENPGDTPGDPVTMDIKVHDIHVPNVLIPAGAEEPFISHSYRSYDMAEVLKNNFPDLAKLTSADLTRATALQMFHLMQMPHPTEHGIDVNRSDMLAEWKKRGKEIFEQLGYPTDEYYPYVNIHTGYKSVSKLGKILRSMSTSHPNSWWSAAESYRPVADLNKGIDILDQFIERWSEQVTKMINPKTGKPKGAYKEDHRSIQWEIEQLEEGKAIINEFLNKNNSVDNGKYHLGQGWSNLDEDTLAEFQQFINTYPQKLLIEPDESYLDIEENTNPKVANAKIASDLYSIGFQIYKDNSMLISSLGIEGEATYGGSTMAKTKLKKAIKYIVDNPDSVQDQVVKKDDAFQQEEIQLAFPELEAALWNDEDEPYPVNKVKIDGTIYNQSRLRNMLLDKMGGFPIETQLEITEKLSQNFKTRQPLEEFEHSLVTIGKSGDKRKAAVIRSYIDNILLDNGIIFKEPNEPEVFKYMIDLLIKKSNEFADLPKQDKKKDEKKNQHELNREIEGFIVEKDNEEEEYHYSLEDKNFISQYSGSGGLIKQGAEGKGILYEYYTPDEIVKQMWGLANKYGYNNGAVLEPACGTGNFLKYAPGSAEITGYEINPYANRIAEILYPHATIYQLLFETIFFAGYVHLKDDFGGAKYDLVIGNPPYGEFSGKWAGMGEKKWTGAAEYDHYFLTRGLDLLKSDGLLVFIIPSAFLTNGAKYNKIKEKIAAKADLLDAYRLPTGIFKTTDIGTDIVVFKKKQQP